LDTDQPIFSRNSQWQNARSGVSVSAEVVP
jgi:hypothetical protein